MQRGVLLCQLRLPTSCEFVWTIATGTELGIYLTGLGSGIYFGVGKRLLEESNGSVTECST